MCHHITHLDGDLLGSDIHMLGKSYSRGMSHKSKAWGESKVFQECVRSGTLIALLQILLLFWAPESKKHNFSWKIFLFLNFFPWTIVSVQHPILDWMSYLNAFQRNLCSNTVITAAQYWAVQNEKQYIWILDFYKKQFLKCRHWDYSTSSNSVPTCENYSQYYVGRCAIRA